MDEDAFLADGEDVDSPRCARRLMDPLDNWDSDEDDDVLSVSHSSVRFDPIRRPPSVELRSPSPSASPGPMRRRRPSPCVPTDDLISPRALPTPDFGCDFPAVTFEPPSSPFEYLLGEDVRALLDSADQDSVIVVDCRYPFEYEGGHIHNAINVWTRRMCLETFFVNPLPSVTLLFHCEFSSRRGPEMCQFVRSRDRSFHHDKGDHNGLFYPNLCIISGGYRKFYKEHSDLCDGSYVTMFSEEHKEECGMCEKRCKEEKRSRSHNDLAALSREEPASPSLHLRSPPSLLRSRSHDSLGRRRRRSRLVCTAEMDALLSAAVRENLERDDDELSAIEIAVNPLPMRFPPPARSQSAGPLELHLPPARPGPPGLRLPPDPDDPCDPCEGEPHPM